MKEIYVLSGLGADERVFKRVDFAGHKTNFIKWVPPQIDESIENYAKRLLNQIHSNNPVLIGLSFGGIMAIEISKHLESEKIILISSAKTKYDIPFYFRWAGLLKFHKIIPTRALSNAGIVAQWFFGVENEIEKKTLREILKVTDPSFLAWAIDKIVTWKNTEVPKKLFHIHGSTDRLLPLTSCDFTIDNGGHLMILNRAEEISGLLRSLLK